MSKVQYKLDGVKCEGCVRNISAKLSELDNVSNFTIDLPSLLLNVEFKDTVHHDEVINAVASAGKYSAFVAH